MAVTSHYALFSERPQVFHYSGRTASLPSLHRTPPLPPPRPRHSPTPPKLTYPAPLPFLRPRPQTPSQGQVYSCTAVGSRAGAQKQENQDAFFHAYQEESRLLGVCDGHGKDGQSVAAFISHHLPDLFFSYLRTGFTSKHALNQAYLEMNRLLQRSGIRCGRSGSTCTAVVLQGNTVHCSNVGDSRAVLGRCSHGVWSVFQLSWDHTPEDKAEKDRVQAAGGEVTLSKNRKTGRMRVYVRHQSYPGLAMTRAIGDLECASAGIIATPVIESFALTSRDRFVLLATDGLWAVMSSFEAVSRVAACLDQPELVCDQLVAEARGRWLQRGSVVDDITVVIACIHP